MDGTRLRTDWSRREEGPCVTSSDDVLLMRVQAEVVVEKVARGLADGLALGRFPVLQYASVESGGVDAGKQLIQDMLEGRRRRREGQQL